MSTHRPLCLSALLALTLFSAIFTPVQAEPMAPRRKGPHFHGAPPPESLTLAPFGEVGLYRQKPHPHRVALYLSGDGGWNRAEAAKVSVIEALDTLVLGIDMRRYLINLAADPRPCADPAGDLEALARAAEKKAGYPAYVTPVIVGYSSGATLAYAALAEAGPHAFRGGIGIGFCADFPDKHPLCPGSGLASAPDPRGKGIDFLPAPHLEAPFVAINGKTDRVCPRHDVRLYMRKLQKGKLVLLPHVGHGFGIQGDWTRTFRQAYDEMTR